MVVLIGALLVVIVLLAIDDVRIRMEPNQSDQNGSVNGRSQGNDSGSMQLDNFGFIPDIAPFDPAVDGNSNEPVQQPQNDQNQTE
ncbi:MAG TPA: hypothetical protein VFT53_04120 [Candidatus Saccharimonadales bacterium]|nr:hypothetical protein [Candidatus Saccharimonadales bacterium]